MSPEIKKFLTLLTVCAFAGWIGGNWLLGPPGLSSGYLAEKRAEHEHYIEIIKSADYKRYSQRPHLVDLSEQPGLQGRVAFVEQYTANEAFQAEQHRIELYYLFFEFFNAALVVVLIVRLAKAPLFRFLEGEIEALREKMNQAARSRKTAVARRAAAEVKLDLLPETEMKLHAETEHRMERELQEVAEAKHYRLGLQERELAERKAAALHNAEVALKRRLVNEAITALTQSIRDEQSADKHAALIDDFLSELEARR